jgi:DNA segregation ATPase FtsK/SpoIIIE-like protein
MNLPIEHLSYSSLKLLCSNQQQFFKNYILGLFDYQTSVTAAVGKAGHKCLEIYYKTGNIDQGIEEALALIHKMKDVDYGKTGSLEGLIKDFHNAIDFYRAEEPKLGEILGVEQNITTDKGLGGEAMPLPIKAISDLVTRDSEGLKIFDYKFVAAFTDKEDEQPDYIMQAMFNRITVHAKYGVDPISMTFIEVKKSQNRNGEPQLQMYEVVYSKHPEYINYFNNIYADAILTLADEDHRYLPNFADYFSGKEAWKDYTAEVIDFKTLPKISHRSNMQQAVRDVKFIDQAMETDATLTEEDKVRAKLKEFGIAVEMGETFKGLNVTLFTMKPSRGVRMSTFHKHADDLKLALSAKSVRIEAPIPGTSLVGVEVSNKEQGVIGLEPSLQVPGSLSIPVGIDVYGKAHLLDLTKAPHLLIGGTTGSGKSVFMNAVITTLINENKPEDMKLLLIDPKRTEFIDYEDDAHLAHTILTEATDADLALQWAVVEMENRYVKLREMRVKTIAEYRKNASDMPYLVIVIDELADLMLSGNKDGIETSIVRLAQKSRAVGIHLVVATQRPSVDVVTGLIKANFPTRVGFMVSTGVDSKVILDETGAENLIGNGDLLFMNPREKGLQRLQGYFTK